MPDFYKTTIPIYDPDADEFPEELVPQNVGFGLIPRDYAIHPQEMFDPPSTMQIIPQSEWDARFDEQEATQSSLEHVFLPNGSTGAPAFVNLDQNGDGYCWAYSTAHSVMIDRLRRGRQVVRLNPHSVAAIIKNGRNEGGWCGLSAQFFRGQGCAVEGTGPGQWPLHSRDLRYNTPALRAAMMQHRIEEEFTDLTQAVYDQNLTRDQCATSGFNNWPGPRDYNWWGHSVCGLRWVRIERGDWGQLILNSWKGWGRHGLAVLRGSQAICNGGLAIRSTN